jgi:hypothetical protein
VYTTSPANVEQTTLEKPDIPLRPGVPLKYLASPSGEISHGRTQNISGSSYAAAWHKVSWPKDQHGNDKDLATT